MATWITHLRLAEQLVGLGMTLDVDSLLVGSVAPDAGLPNANLTGFEPPKRVTHWHNGQGKIDPEAYYRRYLAAPPLDDSVRAFHAGYYLHLVADNEWDTLIWQPKKRTPLYQKALADMNEAVHEIKRDWYGLDFLYLKAHPTCMYYERFLFVDTVPDYLDYLPAGLLTATVLKIQAFYRLPQFDLQRPYHYLSQAEIDAYVELTGAKLANLCRGKGWL